MSEPASSLDRRPSWGAATVAALLGVVAAVAITVGLMSLLRLMGIDLARSEFISSGETELVLPGARWQDVLTAVSLWCGFSAVAALVSATFLGRVVQLRWMLLAGLVPIALAWANDFVLFAVVVALMFLLLPAYVVYLRHAALVESAGLSLSALGLTTASALILTLGAAVALILPVAFATANPFDGRSVYAHEVTTNSGPLKRCYESAARRRLLGPRVDAKGTRNLDLLCGDKLWLRAIVELDAPVDPTIVGVESVSTSPSGVARLDRVAVARVHELDPEDGSFLATLKKPGSPVDLNLGDDSSGRMAVLLSIELACRTRPGAWVEIDSLDLRLRLLGREWTQNIKLERPVTVRCPAK